MMCAFMTPVLKNDWEVYNTKRRSRNNSESSQKSLPNNNRSQGNDLRRRVLGESRSMSYHMGNSKHDADLMFAKPPPRAYHLSTRNSRNASRASFSPVNSEISSPTKRSSKQNNHHRSASSSSLNKFHTKVMDKLRNVLHLGEQGSDAKDEEGSKEEKRDVRTNP